MRPNWLHRASRSASEGPVGHICSRGEFHEAPGGNRESRGNLSEAPGVNRGPPETFHEAPGLLTTSASGQGERFYRGDGWARGALLPGDPVREVPHQPIPPLPEHCTVQIVLRNSDFPNRLGDGWAPEMG